MNPVFWFLIIVAAFCLWLAISFIFIPLGGILLKMMKRIFNIINCFGTRIGGKVYDVTGDVTENHKWISWVEYSNKKSKDQVTKEDIMF